MGDEEEELVWQQLYEGRQVKCWDFDEKVWKRGNVIEFVRFEADKKPIKVQIEAKKKADRKETWLAVDAVRLINAAKINWESLNEKLPLRQDPESRAVRDKLFDRLDLNAGGSLSFDELKQGIPEVIDRDLGEDFEEIQSVIKRAYNASRRLAKPAKGKKKKSGKAGDKTIDRTEFHGFVTALRHVLQLAELFEELDMGLRDEDDQKLSHRECLKGIDKFLEWNVNEGLLAQLFKGAKMHEPKIKFPDFADFLIEQRWQTMDLKLDDDDNEDVVQAKIAYDTRDKQFIDRDLGYHGNKQKIMEVFEEWDADGSGQITQEEMGKVLTALDPSMTPETVKKLFELSDSNNDGVLDIDEFVKWMLC